MEIYTIGFTRKSARQFFDLLRAHDIAQLIDVRLHNSGQLAGFTKAVDLAYFLDEIAKIQYRHEPLLAPSEELMRAYKLRKDIPWAEFERDFLQLMEERRIEQQLNRAMFNQRSVLLCSEPTADRCHRRLVLEYLARKWGDVKIVNL